MAFIKTKIFKKTFSVLIIFLMLFFNFSYLTPAQAAGTYFALRSSSSSYYLNQIFSVNVVINTENNNTDASDVILYYDPEYLEVIDALPDIPGKQVKTGSIYQIYPGNEVNEATGQIKVTGFSITAPYNSGISEGVFATLTFRAIKYIANTSVVFDFTPGESHDCNLAQTLTSLDILDYVAGMNFSIINDTTPPYITNLNPAQGATNVNPNTDLTFNFRDDQTAVDLNTVKIIVDGVEYTLNGTNKFLYSGVEKNYSLRVDLPVLDYEQTVAVHIEGADLEGNWANLDYQFTTAAKPVNQPPVLIVPTSRTVFAGSTLSLSVRANDPNSGDILTIIANNLPVGATFEKLSNGNYLLTWPTTLADLGEYTVDFVVSDNGDPVLSDSGSTLIRVVEPEEVVEPEPIVCPVCPPCGQRTECSDNRDNDGDGLVDYPLDPHCVDYADNSESVMLTLATKILQTVNKAKEYVIAFIEDNSKPRYGEPVTGLLKIASLNGEGTLALSPVTGNYYPGQEFNINIMVETGNMPTDAVDVILDYNPNYLQVIDSLSSLAGVQVLPGSLYDAYPGNIVDSVAGQIKVTAFSVMSTYNSGNGAGVFATIRFKALQLINDLPVTFEYEAGSTTDSNIVRTGDSVDILTLVNNGLYNIVPDANPPYITNFAPPNASINRSLSQDVSFRIKDDETAVDLDSIVVTVEDTQYQRTGTNIFSVSGNEKDYLITLTLPNFSYEQVVDVYVNAADTQGNAMSSYYSWFQIMPMPVNKPPVLSTIPDQTAYPGTDLSFNILATDADTADILTYSMTNAPAGATLIKLTNNRALFEWTLPTTAQGPYYVTIRVEDSGDPRLFDEQIVTINTAQEIILPPEEEPICPPCPICPQCLDNYDNDGDGLVDYPADPGCSSFEDETEDDEQVTQCSDGIDNDNDNVIDYPYDPGCESASDDDEIDERITQCSDGIDNDGDSYVDYPADPGCLSASDDDEVDVTLLPECSDGLDNDNDGLVDYPVDPGCESSQDDSEIDEEEQTEFVLPGVIGTVITGGGQIIEKFGTIVNDLIKNESVEQLIEDYVTPAMSGLSLLGMLAIAGLLLLAKRRIHGIIYDSKTKKPIGLAVVKVYRSIDDVLIVDDVTDARGRFKFSVKKDDQYFIKVIKQNYVFPSLKLFGQIDDGRYDNLYFGEVLELKEDEKKVKIDIPLDLNEEQTTRDPLELRTAIFRRLFMFLVYSLVMVVLAALIIKPDIFLILLFGFHVFLALLLRHHLKVKN